MHPTPNAPQCSEKACAKPAAANPRFDGEHLPFCALHQKLNRTAFLRASMAAASELAPKRHPDSSLDLPALLRRAYALDPTYAPSVWAAICGNPSDAAVDFVTRPEHRDYVQWGLLCANPHERAVEYLERLLAASPASFPRHLNWDFLSGNPAAAARRILAKHPQFISWRHLAANPAAWAVDLFFYDARDEECRAFYAAYERRIGELLRADPPAPGFYLSPPRLEYMYNMRHLVNRLGDASCVKTMCENSSPDPVIRATVRGLLGSSPQTPLCAKEAVNYYALTRNPALLREVPVDSLVWSEVSANPSEDARAMCERMDCGLLSVSGLCQNPSPWSAGFVFKAYDHLRKVTLVWDDRALLDALLFSRRTPEIIPLLEEFMARVNLGAGESQPNKTLVDVFDVHNESSINALIGALSNPVLV